MFFGKPRSVAQRPLGPSDSRPLAGQRNTAQSAAAGDRVMGSSLVMTYLDLTSHWNRRAWRDIFRCVEVSTLVPAADPWSLYAF